MSELIVSRQQQVLLLTLNRPAARNALNNALLTQLVNELEAAATDSSISVCVITGNARFLQISPLAQCRIENAFIVGIKHDFPIPPILTYSHFLSVTLHVNATFDARARRIKPLQMNGFIWHSQCF